MTVWVIGLVFVGLVVGICGSMIASMIARENESILWYILSVIIGFGMVIGGVVGGIAYINHTIDQAAAQVDALGTKGFQTLTAEFQTQEKVKALHVYFQGEEVVQVWDAGEYDVLASDGRKYEVFAGSDGKVEKVIP